MMITRRLAAFSAVLFVCMQSFAWGPVGHEVVSYVGSQITASNGAAFWQANVDGMRQLSTVPDRVWKAPATKSDEGYNHFFQADAYVGNGGLSTLGAFPKPYADAVSKYGQAVILTNGTAPWRIVQLYLMAVDAFKRGDSKTGVELAGAMSHYIGDLSQPLHVSENYDGQMTNQTGIHAWFETKNIGDEGNARAAVLQRARALLKDPSFTQQFNGDLMDVIYNEISRSLSKRDLVLQNDKQYGRNSAQGQQLQLALAEDRMADGAATLSIILTGLSRDAGIGNNATPIPISDPAWVQNTYQHGTSANELMTPLQANPSQDDCSEGL